MGNQEINIADYPLSTNEQVAITTLDIAFKTMTFLAFFGLTLIIVGAFYYIIFFKSNLEKRKFGKKLFWTGLVLDLILITIVAIIQI